MAQIGTDYSGKSASPVEGFPWAFAAPSDLCLSVFIPGLNRFLRENTFAGASTKFRLHGEAFCVAIRKTVNELPGKR